MPAKKIIVPAPRYRALAEAIAANRQAIAERGEKPPTAAAIRRQVKRQREGREVY